MTVRLRPMLQQMPGYVPGRTVPGAIKLASNETPYPLLPHVVERLAATAATANRYPDSMSTVLTAALADKHRVDAAQVAVGVGSVALCQQLVEIAADAGEEIVFGWRSFEAYPVVASVAGARQVRVSLRHHVHDLPAMAAAVTDRTRLVFVCNPNNPTSTAVGRPEIEGLLRSVPSDVLVVLDEAYHEFVTDPDVPDGIALLPDHPNLVVLRTFSKAYGLAGLRVGYAVAADPAIPRALKQVQIPFAVTSIAQEAALACLEPAAEKQLLERVDDVVSERIRVRATLLDFGYDVPATESNFVWLPLGAATTAWADGCAHRGVIVRPFANEGVRVTVGTPAENDRLLEAAAELTGAAATS